MARDKQRPAGIPEAAWWQDDENEWILGDVVDGERQGAFKFWRPDGTVCCENVYVDGIAHGPYKRFHENGEVSQQGELYQGKRHGVCSYHRCAEATTEHTFPEGTPDAVWSSENRIDKGVILSSRFFDRDGNDVDLAGEPLRPRPEGVPDTARWDVQTHNWRVGKLVDGAGTPVGEWKWWNDAGQLTRESDHTDDGKELSDVTYREDGAVVARKEVIATGVMTERYHDNGRVFVKRVKNPNGEETYKGFWKQDGTLSEETITEWADGSIVARTERGFGGALTFEATTTDAGLDCSLHEADGGVTAHGVINDGMLSGVWSLFRADGSVRREIAMDGLDIEVEPTAERLPWALATACYQRLGDATPAPDELAGVDDIDWTSVEGCYDSDVEAFPALLRNLVADEPYVRTYASGTIYGEIEHQGSVYPATAAAVPFLVKLLAHPSSNTHDLLDTLYEVATAAAPWRSEAEEAKQTGDTESWIDAVLGTLEQVGKGWPAFRALLDTDDTALVRQAILFAPFAADPDAAKRDLAGFIGNDDIGLDARACAVEAVSDMPDASAEDMLRFLAADQPLIHATAAIAAGRSFGPNCPDAVADALHDVMDRWRGLADDYHALPFVDVHMLALLSLAAGSIRTPRARQLSVPLRQNLDEVDALSAVGYGRGMLALAFGSGDLPFADDFVDILDTLASSNKFFQFINAHEVLDAWNLPRYQADLKEFVVRLRAADDPVQLVHDHMHGTGSGEDSGQ